MARMSPAYPEMQAFSVFIIVVPASKVYHQIGLFCQKKVQNRRLSGIILRKN
jgi:hypothetical protein